MSVTASLVSARLPSCLSAITIDYFGRSTYAYNRGMNGQWEDCESGDGDAILSGACRGGHLALAEMIMAKNPNCNFKANLVEACGGGNLDLVKLMISKVNYYLPDLWQIACMFGHLNIVEYIASLEYPDWDMGLIYACANGHLDLAKFMVANGASCWQELMSDSEYYLRDSEIAKFIQAEMTKEAAEKMNSTAYKYGY